MPKTAPRYLHRREKPPRSDRAITTIDGKRHYLGVYGPEELYRKLAALLDARDKADDTPAARPRRMGRPVGREQTSAGALSPLLS